MRSRTVCFPVSPFALQDLHLPRYHTLNSTDISNEQLDGTTLAFQISVNMAVDISPPSDCEPADAQVGETTPEEAVQQDTLVFES